MKTIWHVLLLNKEEHVEPCVAWFYAEPCRAEKHVQEDKKNMCRTELNCVCWGGYLAAPQTFTTPPDKKEKKLCRNEHTYMHAFNRSGQREKKR
jgi:hypothetical protein